MLGPFVTFLNTLHGNIKFTMEVENEGRLLFLDVLIIKKPDGTLGHTLLRKATHTNLYLNKPRPPPPGADVLSNGNANVESKKDHG